MRLEVIRHAVRFVAGLAILGLWFVLEGDARWWALIGLVPIISAAGGSFPPRGSKGKVPGVAEQVLPGTAENDAHRQAVESLSEAAGPSTDRSREAESYRIVPGPDDCFDRVLPPPEPGEIFLLKEMSGRNVRPQQCVMGCLAEGRVLGLSLIAASAERKVCLEGFLHNPARLAQKAADEQDTLRVVTKDSLLVAHDGVDEHDEGVLIGNHENFGHWLLNHVGRVFFKEAYRELDGIPIVVGDNVTPRQEELLALIGYPGNDLIKVRRGRLAMFRKLWVPGMPYCVRSINLGPGAAPGMIYWTPEIVHALRRRLGVPARREGRGAKLYLTRRGARWRRLLNEETVEQFLAGRGFHVVDPAALTIAEQLDLARNAETIVGVFGAGMNLLIFAPADAKIVELKYQVGIMDINPFLCRHIGQTYLQVLGVATPTGASMLNYDFAVPVEGLARALGD